jgi:multiple sugar transport system ATP-binding protein
LARGESESTVRQGRTVAEVRLDRVVKRYAGRTADALQETSLTFEQGLFTCVLGPSGSGKSTVLKLLAGIEEVTSGRIFMDGADVTNVTPERRDVAMVFQSYGLYPNMTARDNIAFPLMLRGLKKPDRYGRVDEVARMLGIGDLLDRHPRVLSGGERQRVALGRAIVRNPKVFLLDEPISNLDANLRATTREELKRIHQQLNATFIYVTHDQDDAEAMGDRVVVMAKGAVQQVDAPAIIYRRPANRFVASFVGRLPMNFIPGLIFAENDRTWFASDVIRVELQTQDPPVTPGPVVLGIRPEGVTVVPRGEQSGMTGRVTLTEVVAPDEYATIVVADRSLRARVQAEGVAVGDEVGVAFVPSHLLFFDPQTGARITMAADSGAVITPRTGLAR